jgi:hypothetical protein
MGRVAERAWIAPNLDRPKVPISTGHFRPIASADRQKMCTQSPPSCFASSQASAQHLDLSVIEPGTDGCLGSLIAVIAVGITIARDAPFLAVLPFVSVVPAFFVTAVKAPKMRRRGEPMSFEDRFLFFYGLTFLIPVVFCVALTIAFFAYLIFVWN